MNEKTKTGMIKNTLAKLFVLNKKRAHYDIFEYSAIGMYRTSPDGSIIKVNQALLDMLGYESLQELSRRNLESEGFIPDYPRDQFTSEIEKNGFVRGLEAAWKRSDGAIVYVRENAHVVRDKNGKTLYYEGIAEDISEQKLAQRTLLESELRYRTLFEKTTNPILVINKNGYYIDANQAALQFLECTKDQLLGQNVIDRKPLDFDNPADMEMHFNAWQHGARIETSYQVNGTVKTLDLTITPGVYKGIEAVFGIGRDITEERNMFMMLAEKKEFLHHLNQIVRLGLENLEVKEMLVSICHSIKKLLKADDIYITLWDNENKLAVPIASTAISNEAYQKSKRKPLELTMTKSVLDAGVPLVAEDVYKSSYLSPSVAANYPSRSLMGLPLTDHHNKIGALLVGYNEQHTFTEEEIEKAAITSKQIALIASKIHLIEELTKKEKNLRQINDDNRKLFSIITHDLRNPFGAFLGILEFLEDEFNDLTNSYKLEVISSLRESAVNINNLIENLLHWTSLQYNTISINPKSLFLHAETTQVIELIKIQAKNKNIKIDCQIPHDVSVLADPNALTLILRNLITNAIKFTPTGGSVSISAAKDESGKIIVTVSDNGIGMNEQFTQNLFNNEAKTTRFGTEGESSTGIGLMLTRDFVQKSGGEIWVRSTEGEGSDFSFSIPAS